MARHREIKNSLDEIEHFFEFIDNHNPTESVEASEWTTESGDIDVALQKLEEVDLTGVEVPKIQIIYPVGGLEALDSMELAREFNEKMCEEGTPYHMFHRVDSMEIASDGLALVKVRYNTASELYEVEPTPCYNLDRAKEVGDGELVRRAVTDVLEEERRRITEEIEPLMEKKETVENVLKAIQTDRM